jgi:chromosome segregation ATPase
MMQARDIRNSASTGPSRKERAEIEALQVTVEQLKVDHEQAMKKWKTNATRLQQKNKEQAQQIEELEQQVSTLPSVVASYQFHSYN